MLKGYLVPSYFETWFFGFTRRWLFVPYQPSNDGLEHVLTKKTLEVVVVSARMQPKKHALDPGQKAFEIIYSST